MRGKKPKWLQRRLNRRSARYNDQSNPSNGMPHTDVYRKSNRWVKAERRRKREEKWAALLGKGIAQ